MLRVLPAYLIALILAATAFAQASTDAALEFKRRRARLAAGDHAAAMVLAEWAVEKEMLAEADELYREILRRNPEHGEAYGALWYLSGGRSLPKASKAYEQAKTLLPAGHTEHLTSHYVILSDADPKWVRELGKRLERAHDRFVHFARTLGLRPLPIEHRLVAVVFSDVKDFRGFSRHDDLPDNPRIAGYYSVTHDRLVFYHVESTENVASTRQQLEELDAEIEAVRRESRRVSRTGRRDEGRRMLEGLDDKIRRHDEQLLRLDAFARERSVVVTIHEAIHQLMFHTQVQSPYVRQPLWLSEGLATTFETVDATSEFGPLQDFPPRRDQFYALLDGDRLMPLSKLITMSDMAAGIQPGTVDALYAQSYALVAWLARHRRLQLSDYIRRLNAEGRGKSSLEFYRTTFEASFGDVDRLEKVWLRHESR